MLSGRADRREGDDGRPQRSIGLETRRPRRGAASRARHVVVAAPVLLGVVLFGFNQYEPGTPPNSLTGGTQPEFACGPDEAYVSDGFGSGGIGACQKVATMPPGAGRDTAARMISLCPSRRAAVTVLDSVNAEGRCR
jgi:hypothetical protein